MGLHESSRARIAGIILLLAGAVFASSAAHRANAASLPQPIVRIELEPLGYQGLQAEFLLAGSPMLTVDFVDQTHLLVTFEVHRLLTREADAGPREQDRVILAWLLELPSGKVLSRAEWRMHDRGQYLWNLGSGRFMLRIRDELMVFAPLAGRPDDAFRTSGLLMTDRRLLGVGVSANNDLLTIASEKRSQPAAGTADAHPPADPTPIQFNFYRLKVDASDGTLLRAGSAGAIRTPNPVALPLTTAGYLDALQTGKNTWGFNFDEYNGKVNELPAFDSTCFPRAVFVDHSEFVAFACRGGTERRTLAAFNLRGEEMWQQGFYESYVAPVFSFAPAAGRFALSRVIVPLPMAENERLNGDLAKSQEIRVYQTYTGQQLFHIDCSPVERAGQNFALSADGLRLAVVREVAVRRKATRDSAAYTANSTGIEIYALPGLSTQDESAVKAATLAAPPDTDAAIDVLLARIAAAKSRGEGRETAAPPASRPTPPPSIKPPAAAVSPAASAATPAGPPSAAEPAAEQDESPQEPRKPPTLYEPGDSPQSR